MEESLIEAYNQSVKNLFESDFMNFEGVNLSGNDRKNLELILNNSYLEGDVVSNVDDLLVKTVQLKQSTVMLWASLDAIITGLEKQLSELSNAKSDLYYELESHYRGVLEERGKKPTNVMVESEIQQSTDFKQYKNSVLEMEDLVERHKNLRKFVYRLESLWDSRENILIQISVNNRNASSKLSNVDQ